jgi:hypothetical protein
LGNSVFILVTTVSGRILAIASSYPAGALLPYTDVGILGKIERFANIAFARGWLNGAKPA